MNDDEMFKQVQQSSVDEQEEQVKTKAFHIGWLSVTIVILLLIFLRNYYNEPANDLLMILMAQISAFSFYIFFKLRDRKGYLFSGILSAIAFFLLLSALLSDYGVY